jgi:hypothetical protein
MTVSELVDRLEDRMTKFFADGIREAAVEASPELALEMLADGLYETGTPLTRDEVEAIERLAAEHGADRERITPLRQLIA